MTTNAIGLALTTEAIAAVAAGEPHTAPEVRYILNLTPARSHDVAVPAVAPERRENDTMLARGGA